MHAHGSHRDEAALATMDRRRKLWLYSAIALILAPIAIATAAGIAALWPGDATAQPPQQSYAVAGTTFPVGTVDSVERFTCQQSYIDQASPTGAPVPMTGSCSRLTVSLDDGSKVKVDLPPQLTDSGAEPGTQVKLIVTPGQDGSDPFYGFYDYVRTPPMLALAILFIIVVVAVARLRGLAALIGLVISFAMMIKFMTPSLLQGHSPLAVALVTSSAILFVVLYLAHGFTIRTHTALIGTLAGLGITALLAVWATGAAHLTGFSSDDTFQLDAVARNVRLSDIILCGMVIAGLGVLNDVTVTQASAVWELRALAPDATSWEIFRRAMKIGRDHIASSVYTIVFVYAGAALPVFLLIALYTRPLQDVLNSEELAEEIVRTLVGSIGLVLAVPLTTLVGVLLSRAARNGQASPPSQPSTVEPDAGDSLPRSITI
ncbi:MAG: YibE/F family protein [Actinobacteria bacterium]|nr:YibE/F family protein [Actinomycetota bacterium]